MIGSEGSSTPNSIELSRLGDELCERDEWGTLCSKCEGTEISKCL